MLHAKHPLSEGHLIRITVAGHILVSSVHGLYSGKTGAKFLCNLSWLLAALVWSKQRREFPVMVNPD